MREIFRVSKNLPKDSILWKFFSVERLLELIAKHGLYFTKTEYQQDPSEGFSVFEQIEHNPSNFGDESDLYDEIITIYNYIENNERLVTSLLEGLSAQVELDQLKNSYKGNEQNDIFNKEELSEDEKIDFLRLFFEQLTSIIQGEFHYIDALIDKWKKVNPSVYTIFKADQINHGLNELLKNISRPFVTRREYENAKKELKKSSYLCCFNKGNTINDLLWSYSKGNYGVAIETSIEKIKQNMERKKNFLESTYEDFDFYLHPVKYTNDPKYLTDEFGFLKEDPFWDIEEAYTEPYDYRKKKEKTFIKALTYKKEKFKAEEEIRLIAIHSKFEIQSDSNIFIPIDMDFIKKIHLNPYLKRSRAESYKKNLEILFKQSFGKNFDENKIVIDEN